VAADQAPPPPPAAEQGNGPELAAEPEPGESLPSEDARPAGAGTAADGEAPEAVTAVPVPVAVAAATRPRADPGAAARMFDAATMRRRSVVFEEDDELDVPDFLK
jgi:cell division protein FtsZ